MASATEPGLLRLYAIAPGGQKIQLATYRNGGSISAGGSPDNVLANPTADKHLFQGVGGPIMSTGWVLAMSLTADAADGYDASDSFISIPLTRDDGVTRFLNSTDLGYTVDLPAATPANIELPIGAGFTIPNAERWKFGGGPIVISVEDDT
jgi:hypothetical protein